MLDKIENLLTIVLNRISPTKDESQKIRRLTKKIEKKVKNEAIKTGLETIVRLEGSVAKDTWLLGEADIDIFMRVPLTIPRNDLGRISLKIAKKAMKDNIQIERYAEHPYLEAIVENVRINIVPAYQVKRGELVSATDRTPHHTDYINQNTNLQLKKEIRLLKKFFKGIGVYGSEIKIGGFNGYLCELLILKYKTFMNTIKKFAQYKKEIIIDIENHYKRERDLKLLFNEQLVVVDPIDKRRNVASAVSTQNLYKFVAATHSFLENPTIKFFFPPPTIILSTKKLKKEFDKGRYIIFLTFEEIKTVPDILWGQLYKSQRAIKNFIRLNDFKILRSTVWSDEKKLNIIIFELEQGNLSSIKKHLGPPLTKSNECKKFLEKHLKNPDIISGPYIDNGKWVIEVKREKTELIKLLAENLTNKNLRVNIGIADKVSHAINKNFKIIVNMNINKLYMKNIEFAKFLTDFIIGKPKWLE